MESSIDKSKRSLSLIFENVPFGSHVLDVGHGSGIPVARDLSRVYKVTGIDLSMEQIRKYMRQNSYV